MCNDYFVIVSLELSIDFYEKNRLNFILRIFEKQIHLKNIFAFGSLHFNNFNLKYNSRK